MSLKNYFDLQRSQLIFIGHELIGLDVIHKELGKGKIVNVQTRVGDKSLIEIKFTGEEFYTFNELSENLFQIPAQLEEMNKKVISFLNKRDELIKENNKEQLRLLTDAQNFTKPIIQRFELLRKKLQYYNVHYLYGELVDRVIDFYIKLVSLNTNAPFSLREDEKQLLFIESIIQKIDLNVELNNEEIEELERWKLFNLIATSYFRNYKKNNDQWMLIKACRYLRKAGKPELVIKHTEEIYSDVLSQQQSKFYAALITTRGASFKDMGQMDRAKILASQALHIDESKFSHNLMASICYLKLDFENGDFHFERAFEMGSSLLDRDFEINNLRQKLDQSGREKLEAHLISINLKKFK